ncbi:HAD family phosphatase [Acuticoccus sp. I52.16.1]|uniref:HAD family hydrolase n=1 Tax=Acuticoccus sp. I52.16.1 TaxID=2928472 RepID=UPI001FD54BA3|nr:HAD family hydrolase [Acuticoccus sp. I52.16.1]UOM36059.1 haloacid dehalogenase-like hydrolase [Acuticoccus sp. I52.16.1]
MIPHAIARRLLPVLTATLLAFPALAQDDPLPSWNDGPTKSAIVDFVDAVTTEGSADYVAAAERIATFDNDGTLWVEQPVYTQLVFAFDRVKALAPDHPEWATTEPFKSVLAGDVAGVVATGHEGVAAIIGATHAGMSTADFETIVTDWLATARHPKFDRAYTTLVYQPMLELLAYLRANEFKTFIVSGGGIEFMRPWTEEVYGIPPEQVVGSSIKTRFEMVDGKPVLMRLAEVDFIDDKDGKPVGINSHIGRRPIAAFGNSAGDTQMLQWTGAGEGRRLMMLVLHDDAEREYAYGPADGLPDSSVGTFPQATMDEAEASGWHIISMKDDWTSVFPPAQ